MLFVRWVQRLPPHRILSVCHVLAARSMEKQPASYMHENWQSGPARHLNFGNLCLRCSRLLLPVLRPPHSQCFPSPKIAARRTIIYCENSLRGDDWLYKQLVSRLRRIGWALQQVRLLRLRGDFNAAPAPPAFTFRRVRGAAQLGINPVWGFLLQLEWRDAGSGSGGLGRAGSYRGPTGPPLMQSYSSASPSLSLIPIIQPGITTPRFRLHRPRTSTQPRAPSLQPGIIPQCIALSMVGPSLA